MKLLLSLPVVLFLLFYACTSRQSDNTLLDQAENLMSQHPDSALTLLQSVSDPQQMSASEYALWCLLLTQAQDKCYIPHTSDSLINQSVQYFENTTDRLHYGTALYYKARICQDLRQREEAVACFLKAKDELEPLKEYKTLFLIATHLGSLYAYQKMPVEAMDVYQDAYQYAILNNDSSSISFGLSFIGRVHGLNNDWNQSIESYDNAIRLATAIQDTFALRLALNEQISAYSRMGKLDEVITNYKRLDSIANKGTESDIYTSNLRIGNLYRMQNQPDQAIPYLENALQSTMLRTLQGANQSLSYIYESQGDYKKALAFQKQFQHYKDSIANEKYQQSLQELNKKYETEKLQNINSELNWKRKQNLFLFIIVSLLLVIIIYYFNVLIIRKNKKLFIMEQEVENYKWHIEKNRKIIEDNAGRITQLSKEIEKIKTDKNHAVSEKYLELIALKEQLLSRNKELTRQNRMYNGELEKLKTTSVSALQKAESGSTFLLRLRNNPVILYDADWDEIKIALNAVDPDFLTRLSELHPDLTADDIKYCCLFKLRFSSADITTLMNVQSATVSKRKLRIRSHLNPDLLNNQSLDDYLRSF